MTIIVIVFRYIGPDERLLFPLKAEVSMDYLSARRIVSMGRSVNQIDQPDGITDDQVPGIRCHTLPPRRRKIPDRRAQLVNSRPMAIAA